MAGPLNPVPEAGDSHPGLLKPSQVEVPPPRLGSRGDTPFTDGNTEADRNTGAFPEPRVRHHRRRLATFCLTPGRISLFCFSFSRKAVSLPVLPSPEDISVQKSRLRLPKLEGPAHSRPPFTNWGTEGTVVWGQRWVTREVCGSAGLQAQPGTPDPQPTFLVRQLQANQCCLQGADGSEQGQQLGRGCAQPWGPAGSKADPTLFLQTPSTHVNRPVRVR